MLEKYYKSFEKFERYLFGIAIIVLLMLVLYNSIQKAIGKTCIEQEPIYNMSKTRFFGTYCKKYA